jgi:HSP20 family molecular chaperone IbpA
MSTETTLKTNETTPAEKMAERPAYAPPVDIFENKDEILILADVPGVSTEDLTVNMDKDQLVIVARHPATQPGQQAFDYRRTFVVPRGIDAEGIAANLQNGVLKLTLPKPAAMKPRQIAVKAG